MSECKAGKHQFPGCLCDVDTTTPAHPGPSEDRWILTTKPRNDGLVNIYNGPQEIALCVRPRDAARIAEAVNERERIKRVSAMVADYDARGALLSEYREALAADARWLKHEHGCPAAYSNVCSCGLENHISVRRALLARVKGR